MPTNNLDEMCGITPEIKEKLVKASITMPLLLSTATVEQLMEAGVTEVQAQELIDNARTLSEIRYLSPSEFADRFFSMSKVSTGSQALDDILGAGIETMTLTEFFGPAASGKSQICMQLSINAQLPEEKGGLASKVLYIDTEGSFNPTRIEELAKSRDVPPQDSLRNIFYVKVSTLSDLFDKVNKAKEFLSRGSRLLIIDNIINPFHNKHERYGMHETQLHIQRLLGKLLTYADELNVAVVFTNRVYSMPDSLMGEDLRPFGGLVLEKAVHKKVLIRRHQEGVYRASLYIDPPRQAFFKIDSKGVGDL